MSERKDVVYCEDWVSGGNEDGDELRGAVSGAWRGYGSSREMRLPGAGWLVGWLAGEGWYFGTTGQWLNSVLLHSTGDGERAEGWTKATGSKQAEAR